MKTCNHFPNSPNIIKQIITDFSILTYAPFKSEAEALTVLVEAFITVSKLQPLLHTLQATT
jgi:hypothetical protein